MRAMLKAFLALAGLPMGGLVAAGCDAQVVLESPSSINYKAGSAAAHDFYVDGARKVDISSSGIVVPAFTAAGVVTNDGSGLLISSTILPSGLTVPSPIVATSQTILGNFLQAIFHDTHSGSCTDGSLARISSDGTGNFFWQTNTATGCDFSTGTTAYTINGVTGTLTAPNLVVTGSSRWPMNGPPFTIDFSTACPGPFGSTFTQLQICYAHTGSTSNGINSNLAVTGNVDGSGTFGQANANIQVLVSLTKNNFLKSTQDGELQGVNAYITQGDKGDGVAFVGAARKVREGNASGPDQDSGAAGLVEGAAQIIAPVTSFTGSISGTTLTVSAISSGRINREDLISGPGIPGFTSVVSPAGHNDGGVGTYELARSASVSSEAMQAYRVTQDIHPVMAFQEGANGISGGRGFGFYSEDFLYPGYAAFQATTHNEYGGAAGSYGWIYLLNAVSDRSAAKQYFAVVGDQAPSGYIPGDIVQGTGANSKVLRTTPDGTWHVVNAAKTADVLTVTNAGTATLPLYAGTGSRPACFTASGQLEAGTLSGGTVTCP